VVVVALAGRSLTVMLVQFVYIACCLAGIAAIFVQQRYRYRRAKGCRWWLYTLLALGLAYEGFETWKFGAPAFPAGRWLIVPSLAAVMAWAAWKDWGRRDTY